MLGAKLQVQFTQHLQRPESSASPVSGLHFGIGSAEGHQFSGSPAAPVGREIDRCAENIFVCISISLFTDTVRFCFKIKRPFGIIARVRGTSQRHCSISCPMLLLLSALYQIPSMPSLKLKNVPQVCPAWTLMESTALLTIAVCYAPSYIAGQISWDSAKSCVMSQKCV